ncbi:starch phosphorylase [Clostridium acetobutylicum]|uniref:glycogen phosphorylase n=1 Tax=Clostridium acetobutylicum (strain ATCC 824 / DSM 792 / JCM 1419 / IAM 19013 / LMG 5710 / NBRC 13948 / NRRL B-527 / VKM B-1787 / 2291 / W) TaxID=272562 RepID=Q97KR0_CLOAB|nr:MULTISPECIES: alpha-glucan family phosphorylase [Clostridium]AAK78833.1 Glucan phosphorylase [Clostridium acetobutylicum ATCC 824]ADZ19908.1 Glucan phosphorylase [Clostridium acetobutylicum EA 2018]AEI34386.1 glucan phosphorylase [Clostridium acetobutylicum DSM 1731]AWV80552.1 alpha-glucan family phosphorylase [Clostridium acetobutylicum]MBC2392742.1 alpha-glucan family phosphorylase [Clostridium acetobutylicum]
MWSKSPLPRIAYFSMEYAIDASIKTYAGGLGILAGDYLKGSKDYNYPIIGIGIKWKQGYTDQLIDENSNVYDTYHNYKYDFLKDTKLKVKVKIYEKDVTCKIWLLDKFKLAPLYLLDTDLPENDNRWITNQLYGGFEDSRLAQEIVLGIGGVRALRALDINVDVYHFNEGHALFAGFELVREKMNTGIPFDEAVKKSKEEIVFTTHTPIIEGNESHSISRMISIGANNGFTIEQLISLGGCPFNMTVGALRLSRISNAVSKLHGETANKMWKNIKNKSKIISITNAIHIPTWVDEDMLKAAEDSNSNNLWTNHIKNKRKLISFVKERNEIELNENSLLIGFSRRAAPYKRSNLIFSDMKIISPLLKDGKIQIVFSGKAHPLDDTGKDIIKNLVNFSKQYPSSVVFLENYDMTIGKLLTQGSDVWLNNPRRPLEASGTSGMKAAMNGVLNLSTLDGWWPEACRDGINGWQFGDGLQSDDIYFIDKHDANALYEVLMNKVIPTFYLERKKWISMMKNSILSTKDYFSVKRMLEEYYSKIYIK